MRAKKKVDRPKAGFLTKVVIVVLLAAIGWQIYGLRGQIAGAQTEKENYAAQVEEMTSQKVPHRKNWKTLPETSWDM